MTWRPRPRTTTAGCARVLAARQVGGGGGLVGDRDHRRAQRAARRVVAPAPVVERREAGDADRDVDCPRARRARTSRRSPPPARPARRGGADAARSARAEPSGSTGSRTSSPSSGALEASTPALAHTKPWWVRQISTPRVGAHELGRLGEDHLDVARVLAVLGGEPRARVAGLDVGEAHGARPRPWRRPCARRRGRPRGRAARRRRQRAARRVVARPRPRAGRAGRARAGSRHGGARPGRAGSAARGCARRRRAPRVRRSRSATRSAGGVDVEPERLDLDHVVGDAGVAAAASWRARLSGPKAGSIASGGDSRRALVPVPWRSGTITASGAAPRGRRSARRGRPGRARASRPGRAGRGRGRARAARRDPEHGGGALAALVVVVEHVDAVAARDALGGDVAGDDEDLRRRPVRGAGRSARR